MNERLLLKSYLRTLRLPTMAMQYPEVARQCSEKDLPYDEFLERLAERGTPSTRCSRIIDTFWSAVKYCRFDISSLSGVKC